MNKKTYNRAGLIDGLPWSYDTNHVIKTFKTCGICEKPLDKLDIDGNVLVYTDEFEFCHKPCLEARGLQYEHLRPKDLCSPVTLKKKSK